MYFKTIREKKETVNDIHYSKKFVGSVTYSFNFIYNTSEISANEC